MPKFTSQQYAQALFEAISEAGANDQDLVLDNFVKILAQSGDLNKYNEIEKEFHKIEMKAKGISEAEVTVARNVEINSSLMNELNKIVGSKVEMKKKVDENIIGGVVVRVDDTLIDASVKGQLENLNRELKA